MLHVNLKYRKSEIYEWYRKFYQIYVIKNINKEITEIINEQKLSNIIKYYIKRLK